MATERIALGKLSADVMPVKTNSVKEYPLRKEKQILG